MRAPALPGVACPYSFGQLCHEAHHDPRTPVVAITIVLVPLRDSSIWASSIPARRRPAPVPTPLLVLLPPGGVHHDLPSMGVISELIGCFSRKRIFGTVRGALEHRHRRHRLSGLGAPHVRGRYLALRCHDLFVSDFLRRRASAVKVFNWTATLYKGSISYATPMLYAFGFIGCLPSEA